MNKFYSFRQNNSGGHFVEDTHLTILVIIEASSCDMANALATAHGIYFNGCESERDCECCGDRWYSVDEEDGYDVPSYYGTPIDNKSGRCIIHYLDGTIKYVNYYPTKEDD